MNIVLLRGPVLLGPFQQYSFQSWKEVKETFRLCDRDLCSLKNGDEVWVVTSDVLVMTLQLVA